MAARSKDNDKGKAKSLKQSRVKQVAQSYRITKQSDPRIGLLLLGVFVLAALVGFGLLWLLPGHWVFDIVGGLLLGILAVLIVFGRRAQKAAFAQIEGKPGAAAAALSMLRRGWKVDPTIAFNKNQDVVHRVVGPPGIVLVGEGTSPNRIRSLLASERRKHERVASEVTIHEVVAGNSEGAVPVRRLSRHVTKLGRQLKPAEMTGVLARLKALDANRSNIPLPKGPVPTNLKGARQNMRGR
ncbi:MAG: Transmembrane protein MT2276, clustered with lipoate gene [uncultured Nocardioidaceae bacterium]|uniref:Transmembrane protein MT2276, clustered with lipoate protein n=1 Tax=uncultured Nocardioidaceae bacterium TaxID=253824 RepID=A0A6J4MK49_9ACTN|nr:MAG: Transmembrane protein MT2276, clustered with lipoate gene [uncultured Nocardioidaceae bacterium]